jgi:two-component system phosphate regulon sensor histidine kinase PhoR
MANTPEQTSESSLLAAAIDRLLAVRWPLTALGLCLTAVSIAGYVSAGIALLLFAAVVAAAALAPRRSTGRGEADAAATEPRAQLAAVSAADLAAAVPDAMIIFDAGGTTVHANAAAAAAFGAFAPALPVLRRFRAPEMQELIGALLSGQIDADSVEYAERVPLERVYRVTGTRIRGGEGLFVLVFEDQSEARRIDRMRADFIANASHELRTPLASIAGFVETLRGPARDDAKAREHFLKIMQEQTGRMARLIDDLLSLSRLEMKPFLASAGEVNLTETLESVIDALGPMISDTAVEIVREFPDQPIAVAGNRDELFQVFENLLENACKYGRSGVRVVVSIGREADGGAAVRFRDFGPGIPSEHIPRITERFYRVEVESSRGQKGTGLGLAIVKHIVTRHKARLSVKSEVGKGSEFVVHFPPRAPSP